MEQCNGSMRPLTIHELVDLVPVLAHASIDDSANLAALRLREDLGFDDLQLLGLVHELETVGRIDFPPELIETLATVDDVLYYFNVKVAHHDDDRT